jgi:hypothetical protein
LAAVAPCEANDPRDYQSGLLFNPDGYRSYFVSSECFQRVAREFRDASLCAQVRQRGGTPRPTSLHSSGMHLDDRSNVRLYVRYEDIRARWPEFSYGARYTVRATLTLDVGPGNLGGRWSDTFVEGVFPRAERSQALEKDIGF